jgi:hypothetical protein
MHIYIHRYTQIHRHACMHGHMDAHMHACMDTYITLPSPSLSLSLTIEEESLSHITICVCPQFGDPAKNALSPLDLSSYKSARFPPPIRAQASWLIADPGIASTDPIRGNQPFKGSEFLIRSEAGRLRAQYGSQSVMADAEGYGYKKSIATPPCLASLAKALSPFVIIHRLPYLDP